MNKHYLHVYALRINSAMPGRNQGEGLLQLCNDEK